MGSSFFNNLGQGLSSLPGKLDDGIKDQLRFGYALGGEIPNTVREYTEAPFKLGANLGASIGEQIPDAYRSFNLGLNGQPLPPVSQGPQGIPTYSGQRQDFSNIERGGESSAPSVSSAGTLDPLDYSRWSGQVDKSQDLPLQPKRDGHVKATIGGKEYDYTSSASNEDYPVDLPADRITGSRGNFSQMEISGNTPGAKRLEEESALDEIRSAGLRNDLLRAKMTPQEQAQLQAQAKLKTDPKMAALMMGVNVLGRPEEAADQAEAEYRAEAAARGIVPDPQKVEIARNRGVQEHRAKLLELAKQGLTNDRPAFE